MAAKKSTEPFRSSRGKIGYTTSNVFRASLAKVWDAAVLSKHLKKHFVDGMEGEFGPKLTPVTWSWKQFGGWTFTVVKYVKHKEVVYRGPSMDGKYELTIRFEFLRKDGKTIFRIHEDGYPMKDLKSAFMMCEGWTEFHTGIKAYLAGRNLRQY